MNSCVCLALLALAAVATATSTKSPKVYEAMEDGHYRRCVEIRDVEPCAEFPDGDYNICDVCQLGYFASCVDREITFKTCKLKTDANGNKFRKVFDSNTQSCRSKSDTCPSEFILLC
ncbi:hypothetical protein ElyMa_004265200 [Elysia marginata]|uniref:Kazal-like domain-containing protein n=1 Tax=Elysia marginata TaxID=1093978 RepID=A0AAV4GWZ1_9GAST|nr:hypothetical protein ElyMa_004265200 [Elysia marginata]